MVFVLFAISLVCFAVGVGVQLMNVHRGSAGSIGIEIGGEGMGVSSEWNELFITQQLRQLRDQKPDLIPHFVESVKERFIVRQDDRTAQVRLGFLRSQLEQLKLAKEFQQTIDDIQLLGLEKAKRVKTLELETEELDNKQKNRSRFDELTALKERKRIELEIAQLDRQIEELKNSPKPQAQPSPEDLRIQKKAAQEARIAQLRREQKESVEAIPPDLEDQRRKVSNMYADVIERELENLRKIL